MTQACAPVARTVRETLPRLRVAASRSPASPGVSRVSRVSLLAISNAAWQLLSGCDRLIRQMLTLGDGFQDRFLLDPITSSYPARRSIGFRQAQARRGSARGSSGEFRRRRLAPGCSRSGRLPRARENSMNGHCRASAAKRPGRRPSRPRRAARGDAGGGRGGARLSVRPRYGPGAGVAGAPRSRLAGL